MWVCGRVGVAVIHVKYLTGNSHIKNHIIPCVCMLDVPKLWQSYVSAIRKLIQKRATTNTWKQMHVIVRWIFFFTFDFWIFRCWNCSCTFFSKSLKKHIFQTCSTSDTSCEAPNNFRDESSVKVLSMAGVNPDDLGEYS